MSDYSKRAMLLAYAEAIITYRMRGERVLADAMERAARRLFSQLGMQA